MRRRDFITLLGGVAAAWPLVARAEQRERMRRIGALNATAADDPEAPIRIAAFAQALQELGWTVGRNLQVEYRWGAGDAARYRAYATELVALAPDVILAVGGSTVGALQQASRTAPIVFVETTDPVGAGLVASLARPGGNTTGFMSSEYGMAGKWLELLKQLAPSVTRVAVMRDPAISTAIGQFGAIQAVAPLFGVEVTALIVQNADEIEQALAEFANKPNGGLIVTFGALARVHRNLIIRLAERHGLPAIYGYRMHVASGGLASYGPDTIEPYRVAGGYVNRILRGERPADLPVQAPTKYQTVLNMKTARALGLTVPDIVLVRADEVIE
jgi:putative ABC transport system substrate-binding protein